MKFTLWFTHFVPVSYSEGWDNQKHTKIVENVSMLSLKLFLIIQGDIKQSLLRNFIT